MNEDGGSEHNPHGSQKPSRYLRLNEMFRIMKPRITLILQILPNQAYDHLCRHLGLSFSLPCCLVLWKGNITTDWTILIAFICESRIRWYSIPWNRTNIPGSWAKEVGFIVRKMSKKAAKSREWMGCSVTFLVKWGLGDSHLGLISPFFCESWAGDHYYQAIGAGLLGTFGCYLYWFLRRSNSSLVSVWWHGPLVRVTSFWFLVFSVESQYPEVS